MEDIVVSIVMVTYNHEPYIEKAICSVLEQCTKYHFELLIGDDCSTDNTPIIIKKYAKKYPSIVKAYLRDKNIGGTRNGYLLDRKARGKYIAFCEGDDCWLDKNRIQRQVDFLEQNKSYSAICGRTVIIDENDNEIHDRAIEDRYKFWVFDKPIYTLKDFESWKMPGHFSAIMARNVFRQNKNLSIIYKAHPIVGDRTHVLVFALDGSIYCSNHIDSCYRFKLSQTGSNFMSNYRNVNLRDMDYKMMHLCQLYAKNIYKTELNMSYAKTDKFIGAVVTWLNDKSIENKNVVNRIIKYSGQPLKMNIVRLKVIVMKKIFKNRRVMI